MTTIQTNRSTGRELMTAMSLIRYMREGRLVLSVEPERAGVTPSNSNGVGLQTPTVTKLALSRKEAAQQLSVSLRTFDRWVAGGLIHPSGVGRRKIFPVTELQRFLRETSETIEL